MAAASQRRSMTVAWMLATLMCLNAGLAAADCLGGRLAVQAGTTEGVIREQEGELSLSWSAQLEKELQAYADEVALAGECTSPLPRTPFEAVFLSQDRTSSCASDAATWLGQITDLKSAAGRLAMKSKAADVACGHSVIPGTTCAITVCSYAADEAAADDIGMRRINRALLQQEETSEETSQETSEETSEETSQETRSEETSQETSEETSQETSEETSQETSEETSEETSQETSEETSQESSEESNMATQPEAFPSDSPAAAAGTDLMTPTVDAEGIITQPGHPGNGQLFEDWVYEQDPNYRRRLQQQQRVVPRKMVMSL